MLVLDAIDDAHQLDGEQRRQRLRVETARFGGVDAVTTQIDGTSRRDASVAQPPLRADAPRAVERPMHQQGAAV